MIGNTEKIMWTRFEDMKIFIESDLSVFLVI